MALVKVTTPVPDYSGSVGEVHFSGGVGYADPDKHQAELDYFRARGYGVDEEPATELEEPSEVDEEPAPRPAGNASTEVWRTWAVDHGGMPAEEAGQLSRDQLVERFAETETES
jgi:hypothetical protein